MSTKNAHKAKYHFYFTTAVLKHAEDNHINIGDCFGYGEDNFVVDLYPYSNLIYRCVDEIERAPNKWKESELFDLVDNLSDCFWGIIEREGYDEMDTSMPCLDEFELDIKRALNVFVEIN
ncbi:hypothetical protein [Vibrio antiquarius]|uniref:hypothetical protein n=1 Tax=Vibrio antiquarius (strain Ex25) TaxID=150340 RepID=UPI00094192F6|nr:hypothetical protein [Vibrio antiquarius]OKQ18231.1 hypothetical protein H058_00480 [Vibrio antiquarius]